MLRVKLTLQALSVIAASAAITFCSCSNQPRPLHEAIINCDEFALYGDSLIMPGFRLAPSEIPHADISMEGSDTLFCYLFAKAGCPSVVHDERHVIKRDFTCLEEDRPLTSLHHSDGKQHGGYDWLTAEEIYLTDAVFSPDSAIARLRSRISDASLMSLQTKDLDWPVIAPDLCWALAAREAWFVSGNELWRNEVAGVIGEVVHRDLEVKYDSVARMFRGASPALINSGLLPRWMNGADYSDIFDFGVNAGHVMAINFISSLPDYHGWPGKEFADSLAVNAETAFWLPHMGFFSAMYYGSPYPVQAAVADNLVQSVAIAGGFGSDAQIRSVVSSTPLSATAIPLTYPAVPVTPDIKREAVVRAMWSVAAVRAGNGEAVMKALGSLAVIAACNDDCLGLFRGAVVRTLFGISFAEDGIEIRPVVPEELGPDHRLYGLPYRDATLDILVSGHGNVITTFSIDGVVCDKPLIPSDLTGHHVVKVTLGGFSDSRQTINVVGDIPLLPPSPQMEFTSESDVAIDCETGESMLAYIDGELMGEIPTDTYCIDNDHVTSLTIVPVEDDVVGIGARQYLYIPENDSISIDLSKFAAKGARIISDRRLARQFVQSTRYKNASISFDYESATGGDYFVMVSYLDGLGIVNPDRRCALRMLSVNDRHAGLLVFPQLSPDSWRHDVNWQSREGTTLPLSVTLMQGVNRLSIDYWAPDIPDFDHEGNVLIPTSVILVRH